MSIFTGTGVAIITPFHQDGSVNFVELEKLLEFQIENHTDAVIIADTTGEASTLSHQEHLEVIRHCVEVVKGRIPVIAGTGSNCTATAVHLSREAQRYGADGVLVVSPYYNKATQNGLYEHFRKIAEAIQIPVLLYNVPSRTGCNIQPETVVRLCNDIENIIGVKEASGDISQIARLLSLADGKVDVYSGNDDQIVPILSLGGKGVISVLSNVAPKQTHEICQMFFDGNLAGCAGLQLKAMELVEALFCEVNPIPVKSGLNYMGFKAGVPRMPLTELEDIHKEKLKRAMQTFGIL